MANQWSAVRAHQQGLANLGPAPDPQPGASPRPAAPTLVAGGGPTTAVALPPPLPYPPSLPTLATETKGGWANVVPLPSSDFFPVAAEPTPEYELLRWGLEFGQGWWVRWRRYALSEGNVIELDLDAQEIAQREDQRLGRLLEAAKAFDRASDGGKWIWTLRKEELWVFAVGGSAEESPFPDLEALGTPFFAATGSGDFTYDAALPEGAHVLDQPADALRSTVLSDEPHVAFVDSLARHFRRRLSLPRWRTDKLLLLPSRSSLRPFYSSLRAFDGTAAAEQRVRCQLASVPPSFALTLDAWTTPSGASCEPTFTHADVLPLPPEPLRLGAGVPLSLAPYAVPARFIRAWAVEGDLEADPAPVRDRRRQVAAEAQLLQTLKPLWTKETGEDWPAGEGDDWIVCEVDGKVIAWPASRAYFDVAAWRRQAPRDGLDDLATAVPTIADLVAGASDLTASVLKDRQRARVHREPPTPTASAVGTPALGSFPDPKPSPAADRKSEARAASPMAWTGDFADAEPTDWPRSRFDGLDEFDENFDVDAEFSFFDNPSAGVAPASAPVAVPTVPPSVAGTSPPFGSGYTASPSSLNTALFENQTPGSSRPGFTPDTAVMPTPAAIAHTTPPETHEVATVRDSPSIPSQAFGSLSIASARPSRLQPVGYEEVAFRPGFDCVDDHYGARGKYSLPSPDPTLTEDDDGAASSVPAKRAFFDRLADPRTQRIRDSAKKARVFAGRAAWQTADSGESDESESESDSDAGPDEEAEAKEQELEAMTAAAEVRQAFVQVLSRLTRTPLPPVASDAEPAGVLCPLPPSHFPSALVHQRLRPLDVPRIVARHRDTVVSLPSEALPLWRKVGFSPLGGPRDVCVCAFAESEGLGNAWVERLARAYEAHRLGSCQVLPTIVTSPSQVGHPMPKTSHRLVVFTIGSSGPETDEDEDGPAWTVVPIPPATAADPSPSALRVHAFRVYDLAPAPLRRFERPTGPLGKIEGWSDRGSAAWLEDSRPRPLRLALHWPARSLDVVRRGRFHHFVYRSTDDGRHVDVEATDELGSFHQRSRLTLQTGEEAVGKVLAFVKRSVDPISAELRVVISSLDPFNARAHSGWTKKLEEEHEGLKVPRHTTLVQLEPDMAPPILPSGPEGTGTGPGPGTRPGDVEMGEVETDRTPSAPTVSRPGVAVAVEDEPRPLPDRDGSGAVVPMAMAHLYRLPPAAGPTTTRGVSVRVSILDTFSSTLGATRSDGVERMDGHRDEVVASMAKLVQRGRLGLFGDGEGEGWHVARL